ncbi:nitroreductase family protein [Chloroflexota bacterium]
MDYESLLELIKKRRSIHKFKPDPIPDEYVDKIIEAARWAPSGANSQPWEFIVVKKQELKDSIVKLFEENHALAYRMEHTREPGYIFPSYTRPPQQSPGFATAPVFIIICGDPRTKDAFPIGAFLNRGQDIFTSSLASACLYMHLAATALGLGSQWVTPTSYPFVQSLTKALLGIPKELEIYDMIATGYPDLEPKPRPVRSKEEIVHHDYYDKSKFRTDTQIKDFILALRKE